MYVAFSLAPLHYCTTAPLHHDTIAPLHSFTTIIAMTRKKVTHASGIQYLPEPMYRIMGEFCSIENLLHTNSYFFFEVKRNIHYYRFNKTYSLIYHREYHFRDEVKERMKDVSKQLRLDLSGIYISSYVMAKS